MSTKTINLTPELYQYLQQNSLREPEILQALRQETSQLPSYQMQISPEQGQFMGLLVQLMQARKTLDIGTFTGYSALVVALHLPQQSKVITLDIDEKITEIANRYFEESGVAHKISLKLGPAAETLDALLAKEAGMFDFIFIDADKNNYAIYYEKSLQLLRQHGVIAIDNVLWSGRVADLSNQENTTETIRKFNQKLLQDERITLSMLPIGDGLTLALKR